MKSISILGATGSIGTQTLDVIRNSEGTINLIGITANSSVDKIKEIIKKIRKNTIENEIKSMSIQIERLSKELDLLKKSNSNTKEVDDKIMKLSLEILKREKIKKDL